MEQESALVTELTPSFPFEANIEEILSLGLEINHIVILDKLLMREPIPQHPKIGAWIQALERKGYIDKSFCVTQTGFLLLNSLKDGTTNVKSVLKPTVDAEEAFATWWAAYPAVDSFVHKGRRFKGSRSFKNSKDKCKALLAQILKEGNYTLEQLLNALKQEIEQKKDLSVKKNENQMSFMKNTHAYLYQRAFEGFIEASYHQKEEENSPGETFSI
jgi:hypothetical protein